MQKIFAKGKKFCVFCKHWYDPASSALEPEYPATNLWLVDEKAVKMCMCRSIKTNALNNCNHFESKIK